MDVGCMVSICPFVIVKKRPAPACRLYLNRLNTEIRAAKEALWAH